MLYRAVLCRAMMPGTGLSPLHVPAGGATEGAVGGRGANAAGRALCW